MLLCFAFFFSSAVEEHEQRARKHAISVQGWIHASIHMLTGAEIVALAFTYTRVAQIRFDTDLYPSAFLVYIDVQAALFFGYKIDD